MLSNKTLALGSATIVLCGIVSSGCSVFLPRNPNSYEYEGERVTLRMLNKDEMKEYDEDYRKAFPERLVSAVPVAAIGAAVVGLAVDVAAKQLSIEATHYEAQFSHTEAFDNFWKLAGPTPIATPSPTATPSGRKTRLNRHNEREELVYLMAGGGYPAKPNRGVKTIIDETDYTVVETDKLVQFYRGIEIKRLVNKSEEAYKLVLGIAPSDDQQLFVMAPLRFQTKKAKAKVLSDAWWAWLPPMLFGKVWGSNGHEIDSNASIQIEAFWRGQDQLLHTSTVALLNLSFPSYDIDATTLLRLDPGAPMGGKCPIADDTPNPQGKCAKSTNEELLHGGKSGYLAGVPVSFDASGAPVGLGTFTLKALVTEKDNSNAKKYLEAGAKELTDRKSDIVGKIFPQ